MCKKSYLSKDIQAIEHHLCMRVIFVLLLVRVVDSMLHALSDTYTESHTDLLSVIVRQVFENVACSCSLNMHTHRGPENHCVCVCVGMYNIYLMSHQRQIFYSFFVRSFVRDTCVCMFCMKSNTKSLFLARYTQPKMYCMVATATESPSIQNFMGYASLLDTHFFFIPFFRSCTISHLSLLQLFHSCSCVGCVN